MSAVIDVEHLTTKAVWDVKTLQQDPGWTFQLSADDVKELQQALAYSKTLGRKVPHLDQSAFPLPSLSKRLLQVRSELVDGRAVVLIRGLPVHQMSKEDAGTIFWGIGTYLGAASAQNAFGDVLGHVWDLGKDPINDTSSRGYQSRLKLSFHTDATDVVGLLCLRTAKAGGLSSVVSSAALHNEILTHRPDLLEVLYQPFSWDLRGEEPPGHSPYVSLPVFVQHHGRVFCRYIRRYIESAQRFPEVPRLTEPQQEALALVETLAHEERFRYNMEFAPGDMQFVMNYSVLHSRTAYEDHEEQNRKRHLLRLWLFLPELSDRPQAYSVRNKVIEEWLRQPRAPIYDADELMGVSTH